MGPSIETRKIITIVLGAPKITGPCEKSGFAHRIIGLANNSNNRYTFFQRKKKMKMEKKKLYAYL